MVATPEIRGTQAEVLITTTSIVDARMTQGFILTAINFPTPEMRHTQMSGLVAVTPTIDIRNTQTVLLVAIRRGAEDHRLRAWTFTQDDHDFYVLQLGDIKTLVYDKLSNQWAEWKSPGFNYWRGNDGCDWEGYNLCCDTDTGKLWKIDPTGRLDYTTTPIVSQVFGGLTERFRNYMPCFMAEVAISQAHPPAGVDASSVGIQLRTTDTINWVDHGTVAGEPSGEMTYARFYGLGLMKSPGFLFEITDTGYARRIDGLNIEIRDTNG